MDSLSGLANAEEQLYSIQLTSAEMQIQRQVMQFRVDFLSQLNTQAMLLAGSAVSMFSSLELEAIKPDEDGLGSIVAAITCVLYVMCSAISLGASIWVLYTSNNLMNLATVASLYARDLRDLREVDTVIALRMMDVRKQYFFSLLLLLPAVAMMAFKLVAWYAYLPVFFILASFLLHAIHQDYVSERHLLESVFDHLPLGIIRPEWAFERWGLAVVKAVMEAAQRCLPGSSLFRYKNLGKRIEDRISRMRDEGYEARGSVAQAQTNVRMARVNSSLRSGAGKHLPTKRSSGWMLKTASHQGPAALPPLKQALLAKKKENLLELIRTTPANTPTHMRWWTLEDSTLRCFKSPDEAARGDAAARLTIDLRKYVVEHAVDASHFLVIALIHRSQLDLPLGALGATSE